MLYINQRVTTVRKCRKVGNVSGTFTAYDCSMGLASDPRKQAPSWMRINAIAGLSQATQTATGAINNIGQRE